MSTVLNGVLLCALILAVRGQVAPEGPAPAPSQPSFFNMMQSESPVPSPQPGPAGVPPTSPGTSPSPYPTTTTTQPVNGSPVPTQPTVTVPAPAPGGFNGFPFLVSPPPSGKLPQPGATTTPPSFSPPPPNAPGNTINASALTPDETILTVTLGVVLDVPAGQPVPQATLNAFQTSFSKILALPSSAITVYEIDPPTGRKLLQTNRKLGININTAGQSTVTVASAANSVATAVSGGTLATDLQSQGVTTTITGINFQAASASSISPPPASTPPPPSGTGSSESSNRLSGGDIAGIVIGTVAGVAIIGGVIAFVILHQRGKVRRARGAAV